MAAAAPEATPPPAAAAGTQAASSGLLGMILSLVQVAAKLVSAIQGYLLGFLSKDRNSAAGKNQ